ncbi:MAG: amidohydrolase family protein [Alphaproteobacteria bacterium]
MNVRTTVIRNADRVVAWDEGEDGHVYLDGADVVFTGTEIAFVGKGYDGPAESEIDGRGLMVMPGLVNIHCHPTSEPGNRGILEDTGSPKLGQSGLYEYMPAFRLGAEAADAATRVAFSEMLKSGVTTVVDMSGARPGWADTVAATGIRAVLAPMYRSAVWRTKDGHSVTYDWDEAAGRKGLDAAIEAVDGARRHPSGRLDGMLSPGQIDTCSDGLLRDSLDAARERGMLVQIHAAQSVVEFNEITRRHGMTPIEFLDHLGLLGPDTIIGHGIFLNDHPWLHDPHANDFARLADSGAAVAHCPVNFIRRGIALNWLARYVGAGIALGLGTDTFPHNMIDEMRTACHAARLVTGNFRAGTTRHAFDAATVGGARAIRRPDLGRLAVGAKADIVLVDLNHPYMQPAREPLRSLIHSASDRAVRDVYVDGAPVVRGGKVLHIDVAAALETVREGQRKLLDDVPLRDWAGRSADEMSPPVFPVRR